MDDLGVIEDVSGILANDLGCITDVPGFLTDVPSCFVDNLGFFTDALGFILNVSCPLVHSLLDRYLIERSLKSIT